MPAALQPVESFLKFEIARSKFLLQASISLFGLDHVKGEFLDLAEEPCLHPADAHSLFLDLRAEGTSGRWWYYSTNCFTSDSDCRR